MSDKKKDVKISYWAAHFTTIVSVTMLLVLFGAICLVGLSTDNTVREVKQQQQVSLVMQDSISNGQAADLMQVLKKEPYVHSASIITKEQALADWNASTGDNAEEIAGYNFFTPEINISLKADYTSADSIAKICARLEQRPGVEEVVVPDTQIIASMGSFFSRTLLVLGIVAVAMIVISIVLINNTVLLNIYSHRFTIHTMQLVGASRGFIRRPFVMSNLGTGLLSGVIAAGLLAGFISFIRKSQMPELGTYLSTGETAMVCIGIVVAGGLLCAVSALIATNRYLNKNYDELFK